MLFMNEWDIEDAVHRFRSDTPNLARAAATIDRLADWANRNSDGWCYWPKPCRAAKSLIELLNRADRHWPPPEDCTEAELRRAYAPIKAFLTRQGVPHDEVIR